ELLSEETKDIPSGVIYEPYISKVLSAARKEGIFLLAFKLTPEFNSLVSLKACAQPFIAYLREEGYCLVKKIGEGEKGIFVRYANPQGLEITAPGYDFINKWNGHIFSLPLVNILAERTRSEESKSGRFIAVYSYHKEDFGKLKQLLEDMRKETEGAGRIFVYIDELGLIPAESVKKMGNSMKLSEKEAFERAKKSLAAEIEGFERGISTYDENPFYQAQYSYLAKNKVKSCMEDLDYENWKRIVAFDNLNIHDKATRAFCLGDTKTYIKKLEEYTNGFWLYNVKERDENFRKQITKIARDYPESVIFSLRGIGHYGLEEKLDLKGFSIETYVIAEGDFNENLVSDQMSQVMFSNGVNVAPKEDNLLYLRSFPEECIRSYLEKDVKSLTLSTRLAKKIIDRMTEGDIKRLSRDISFAFAKGKISKPEDIWNYVYKWADIRGKIIKE
ncbi:MAG: hypothetical protein NTZ48_06425, partial [Candidatus Omnitrophica bacterium]|nr:hypothetical protein [Candidatus Omnitrophota bacterium]